LGEERHPNDPKEGRPKYSTLSFSFATAQAILDKNREPYIPPGAKIIQQQPRRLQPNGERVNALTFRHRQWKPNDAHRLRSASLSELTTVFCAKGMFTQLHYQITNPDGHRSNRGSGTNVIFADAHVEWIKGTQVGWQ